MANTRQDILTKLNTVLGYITTTNGYNNTLVNYKRGWVSSQEINEYPYACYYLGSEQRIESLEECGDGRYRVEIFIHLFDSVNSDFANAGTLTDKYETWISDFKRFGKNVSGKGLPMRLGSSNAYNLLDLYYDSVMPYIDYNSNRIEIQFKYIGEYIE